MGNIIEFLTSKMSMTDVYQPVVIRELIIGKGVQTKEHLAKALAQYDISVLEYYKKVLMRWPKSTLMKHGVVEYDRPNQLFRLCHLPEDESSREEAIQLCDMKITEWLERKSQAGTSPETSTSLRFQVLKAAGGKCQLCGIPSALRPIDIDHIVPRARANKHSKVFKDGLWMDVDSLANLQALCFTCNRAKRDGDETDFRRTKKLVRDKIPEIIRNDGREPYLKKVSGAELTTALYEKLVEEHSEFIAATVPDRKMDELTDMIEVIFAIAQHHGVAQAQLLTKVAEKRLARGGFSEGLLYLGASPVRDGKTSL